MIRSEDSEDLTLKPKKVGRYYVPIHQTRPENFTERQELFATLWNRVWPEFEEIYLRLYPEEWRIKDDETLSQEMRAGAAMAVSRVEANRRVIKEWKGTRTRFRYIDGYFYEFWFDGIPASGWNLDAAFMYVRWTPTAFAAEIDSRIPLEQRGLVGRLWTKLSSR